MNIQSRLDKLEENKRTPSHKCPGCGQVNACGVVYLIVNEAGDGRFGCINCGCDREEPERPVKAVWAELVQSI